VLRLVVLLPPGESEPLAWRVEASGRPEASAPWPLGGHGDGAANYATGAWEYADSVAPTGLAVRCPNGRCRAGTRVSIPVALRAAQPLILAGTRSVTLLWFLLAVREVHH
jgi:hypothetical protein